MTVMIEDSPRNCTEKWTIEAVTNGSALAGVLSPFASQWTGGPNWNSVRDIAEHWRDAGVEAWFDPMTHALQMSGVGDWRFYDDYPLWGSARGDLNTSSDREGHVRRVFQVQDALGAPHLGPTCLLHHGTTSSSQVALDLARSAVDQDANCWLSIAGTEPFWSSGSALDAHVGALAQLEPAGWIVTVVRPQITIPAQSSATEIFGLCRTVRALSEDRPVYVSHGDLAGLPAIAAGAARLGSGWDQQQRSCGYANYVPRDSDEGGAGSWYKRPTFRGLLGSLKEAEAAVLAQRDPQLSARVGPPPPPGQVKEAFLAHVEDLHALTVATCSAGDYSQRYRFAKGLYEAARTEWPAVVAHTSSPLGTSEWIDPLYEGLVRYGQSEGW